MPKRRIPGLTREWTEYITCLLLHMGLPLLPLLFEAIGMQSAPTQGTLAITAAMYSMAIGLSSENKAMFGFCIMIGFVFSVIYGLISALEAAAPNISVYAWISMFMVFLIHAGERYNRHVADCRPFLEFADRRTS